MSQIASLYRIAPHYVAGTMGHFHFTGDSQASFVGPSGSSLGTNYWLSNGFVSGYTRQWDYFHTHTINSSDQVPSRTALTAGAPASMSLPSYTTGNAQTAITFTAGANSVTGLYLNDTSPIAFAAGTNVADGTWIGNGGFRINPMGTTASPAFPWPDTTETGLPWYHGSPMVGAMVFQDNTNTTREWIQVLARVGNSANNSTGNTIITRGAATNTLVRTAFTADLVDAGNYQVITGGFYPNTHRVELRLYTSLTGYDESSTGILPLSAVFARTNGSGVITSKADGTRLGFCAFSRPGASVADWLGYATQANWRNIFEQCVIPGTRARIVLSFMLGHNTGAGEKSGDLFTATWVSNYVTLINREIAAARLAYPSAEIIPLVIIPWRASESGSVNNEAAARSIHARGLEVAGAVGADWFSFPAAFGFQQSAYFLHPSTPNMGTRYFKMLDEQMLLQATGNHVQLRSRHR